MQFQTLPAWGRLIFDPFIHVSRGNIYFIFLWNCKGSRFKCLVCLLLSWGSGPERLSKCALLISASALPICVICTITDYYENRKGSMLILPEMCLHVKHEAFTKKSLVYSAEGPYLQNWVPHGGVDRAFQGPVVYLDENSWTHKSQRLCSHGRAARAFVRQQWML